MLSNQLESESNKKIPRSHIALKKTTQSLAIHKTIDPHWNRREAARAY